MAVTAVIYWQSFDSIHLGADEARCKVRSTSVGARDRSLQSSEEANDSGIGLKLVVKRTFLEIEEGSFEPTKFDGSDCDAASTAPSGKDMDSTDCGSENGSINSPNLRARKWSDEMDEEGFGDIGDAMSDCSEVDLLSCADDLDHAVVTPVAPPGQHTAPPGQHMPASPPGNFWSGWEGSSEVQWPVECSYAAGPPGTFFQTSHSEWDQWGQCDTRLTEPKQIDEESIGEERDPISQGGEAEIEDSSVSCSRATSSTSRWADMDDSMTLTKTQTTVMLKNLPHAFTRTQLRSFLDSQGFAATYDFIYVPTAFKSGHSFGYAFVNMVAADKAAEVIEKIHGLQAEESKDAKVLEVCYSHPNQGLVANIERYRNSPVMHVDVPDEHRPLLLKNGMPARFPPPTRRIHPPRVRRSVGNAMEADAVCE